jgi:hypothetical protein
VKLVVDITVINAIIQLKETIRMSKIEYYTLEGELISYELHDPITPNCIDQLARLYLEKTNRFPTQVFIRQDLYSILRRDAATTIRYRSPQSHDNMYDFHAITAFNSSIGNINIILVQDAYVPLLVGNHFEYNNNNVNKIFEEVVLDV